MSKIASLIYEVKQTHLEEDGFIKSLVALSEHTKTRANIIPPEVGSGLLESGIIELLLSKVCFPIILYFICFLRIY